MLNFHNNDYHLEMKMTPCKKSQQQCKITWFTALCENEAIAHNMCPLLFMLLRSTWYFPVEKEARHFARAWHSLCYSHVWYFQFVNCRKPFMSSRFFMEARLTQHFLTDGNCWMLISRWLVSIWKNTLSQLSSHSVTLS